MHPRPWSMQPFFPALPSIAFFLQRGLPRCGYGSLGIWKARVGPCSVFPSLSEQPLSFWTNGMRAKAIPQAPNLPLITRKRSDRKTTVKHSFLVFVSIQEITLSEDGSPYPEWRFPPSMACRKWIPHAVTPSVNATARKHMQHQCPYHTLLELPHFVLGMHDLQWLQPRSSSLASPGMPQSEWEGFPSSPGHFQLGQPLHLFHANKTDLSQPASPLADVLKAESRKYGFLQEAVCLISLRHIPVSAF